MTKDVNEAHLGESVMAHNGQKMSIIRFGSPNDIDVIFEDGTVICNKRYSNFTLGYIRNPNCKTIVKKASRDELKKRVGETSVSSKGQKMTIIRYGSVKDVDIRFEDGTVVYHMGYNNFLIGQVSNPNYKPVSKPEQALEANICNDDNMGSGETKTVHVNEINAENNGQDAALAADDPNVLVGGSSKIMPVYNTKRLDRVGETAYAGNGQKMKIIRYGGRRDIDIEFEDGTKVYNREYKNFKKGEVANPNFKKASSKNSMSSDGNVITAILSHVGETMIANNGQKMTIIRYGTCNDIDVEFEDGAIAYHRRYRNFKMGRIGNPGVKASPEDINKRLGETRIANNGQKMTIIRYGTCDDIDVEFEDGTVAYHKRYSRFLKGSVFNPNYGAYPPTAQKKADSSMPNHPSRPDTPESKVEPIVEVPSFFITGSAPTKVVSRSVQLYGDICERLQKLENDCWQYTKTAVLNQIIKDGLAKYGY